MYTNSNVNATRPNLGLAAENLKVNTIAHMFESLAYIHQFYNCQLGYKIPL